MSPRKTLIALIASVALNLFLVGLLVGGAVVGLRLVDSRAVPVAQAGPGRAPLAMAAQGLKPERRPEFRAVLREALLATRPDIQRARALRREALATMDRPDFDPEDVAIVLARARGLEVNARGQVEDALIRYAATLPQAERAEFLDSLRRALIRPGQGRGQRDRANPPPPAS